jgi:hypothetical protein
MGVHPVTGFQLLSVHSIFVLATSVSPLYKLMTFSQPSRHFLERYLSGVVAAAQQLATLGKGSMWFQRHDAHGMVRVQNDVA